MFTVGIEREMKGKFVGIAATCLLLSPAILGYIIDENPRNYVYGQEDRNKVLLKLYEQCLKMDTEACIGYKLFSTARSYVQNTTVELSDDVTENEVGSEEMEQEVDGVLLHKFVEFVTPSTLFSSSGATETARRALRLKRKMLFPLLMGVTLKFVTMIPVILGKLALIGSMAILASKLSLLLTGIIGLKKLFSSADGGLSQQGQHYHDGHYVRYVEDGQHPQQRMTYVVRGRHMGDPEGWTPLVMDESRGLVIDNDKGGFGSKKADDGSRNHGSFAKSVGKEGDDNVRGMSENRYSTANGNKIYTYSSRKQSKSLKSTDVAGAREVDSERNVTYEADKNTVNLLNEQGQLRDLYIKNKQNDINLTPGALSPNSKKHGHVGPVTHHGALYTRDSAETRVESHVTDDRYDETSKESVSGGQDVFEILYNEEKGLQNKAKRLVRRHNKSDMEGQNHDRHYRTGLRRLDEVEGEHVDATVIRRSINDA